ncbi:hypothetical protein BDZ94DRAFT_1326575 [Collybia nuda]|uniref:Uncharacterized protein n=1 Tax=Collybia nuda TaxID=64659 RepID=A0A9P6C9C5_9AGAR|nr:hypothetical protein BDZ94DRAFT_1326575 [Collybia nuda]
MEILHKLVLVTLFVMGTSASPINFVQTRSGSTCLTVLLTLFLFLLLLIVIKHVFMKNRRAPPLISGFSLIFNTSLRPSTSGLPPGAGICHISVDKKAAILVGLLGSPSRETGAEARNTSLSYQLRACSRSADLPTTPRSSPSITQPRSVSVVKSSAGEMDVLYDVRDAAGPDQRKTQSLRLLACPSRAYVGFHDFRIARRFSLPTIREAHTSHMHQKTILNPGSSKIRLSDTLAPSSLADSSLRLMVSGDSPNHLLFSSLECVRASSSQVAQESGTPRSNLDLKLCYSQFSPPPPHTPEISTKDFLTTTGSSPLPPPQSYALALYNSQNTHILSCSNEMPHTKASYVTDGCIRSLQPALVSRAKFQTPITKVPLTQSTSSINYSPLILQTTSADPFYHSGLSTHLASNYSNPPRITYKQNTPPLRARRSPVIGPSPLRSMILPDPSDSDTTIQVIPTGNEVTKASPFDQPSSHASLSMNSPLMGLFIVPEDKVDSSIRVIAVADEEWKNQGCRGTRRSAQVEDEDPNIILQIIRELVEETNDWDASLFVDENFKTMIKGSGFPPSHRALGDPKSAPTELLCNSSEVNLGNTGTNIFGSDGETFIPAEDVPRDDGCTKMATLWANRDRVNFGNRRDEVGLAW